MLATLLAFALFAAACGDDDGAAPDSGPSPETVDDPSEPTAATVPASFSAATSAGQVTVTGAEAGNELELRGPGEVQHGVVDELGNLLFRNVEPGSGWQVLDLAAEPAASSEPLDVSSLDDHPDPALYDAQEIGEGFGYIEMSDGTLLSATVRLPGPIEDGPYPTVVEYSGCSTNRLSRAESR